MLTEEQRIVASHTRGHARVTAVAGAGKTTTMVRYVLERLKAGMDPRLVRVVMFNKAAQEDFSHKLQGRRYGDGLAAGKNLSRNGPKFSIGLGKGRAFAGF